jgi:oxygen-independent coproporphyrinogen-3 oxidase
VHRPAHLYLHIPFCVRACDYCAFYKEAGAGADRRQRFLDGLEREAAARLPRCAPLQTLYLGGGTPSFLDLAEWQRLLAMLHRYATLAPDCEFTVEANPVSLTDEKVALLRAGGVNRISLGVQTFHPRLRQLIGRAGTAERVVPIFELFRRHGLTNLGADLIYAIPGQTLAEWEEDLRRVAALRPSHVSAYSLILEPGTPLARRLATTVDDDLAVAMWDRATELLGELAGLARYEVSNLALPGRDCRHNQAVWHGARFLGLGPSASWYDGDTRYTNVADLDRWLAGAPPEADPLPPAARAVEILASGLRTVAGWTRPQFHQATGHDYLALRGDTLARFAQDGLLTGLPEAARPTRQGLLFADHLARELL